MIDKQKLGETSSIDISKTDEGWVDSGKTITFKEALQRLEKRGTRMIDKKTFNKIYMNGYYQAELEYIEMILRASPEFKTLDRGFLRKRRKEVLDKLKEYDLEAERWLRKKVLYIFL